MRTRASLVGVALAVGLALPGAAQAQQTYRVPPPAPSSGPDPYAHCHQAADQGFAASQKIPPLEAEQERLRQGLERRRKAAARVAAMSPAELDATVKSLESLVQGYRATPPPSDAGEAELAKRLDRQQEAEAMLELAREASAQARAGRRFDPNAGASGRQARAAEARLSVIGSELARLRPARDAAVRKSQECFRSAGFPVDVGKPPAPSAPGGEIDLVGTWDSRAPGMPPWTLTIIQHGDYVTFQDETGTAQTGRLFGDVLETWWRGGLVGKASADGREIRWDNGMVWRRR